VTRPAAGARRHPRLKWPAAVAAGLAALWIVFRIYASGQPVWAVGMLGLLSVGFFVYLSDIAFAYRYLFPGLAGAAVFIVFPLLYTLHLGFTNYSSTHLLSFQRATAYLLEQATPSQDDVFVFTLQAEGDRFRLRVAPRHDEGDEGDPAQAGALAARSFVSPPLALLAPNAPNAPAIVQMLPLGQAGAPAGEPVPLAAVLRHRAALATLTLRLPDGRTLNYAGLHEFAVMQPTWKMNADGSLASVASGAVYRPDMSTGFYTGAGGERLQPGFEVGIGLGNYRRLIDDPEFRGPFLAIFAWTVAFASLTVLFTLVIGCTLAVVLNWEALRFRTVYRTLLFLPYAVPGFISILVFRGLFNQNFGEINGILHALFGIRPAWFADPTLAKAMLLLVNTWLGYPYIMILCTGLIKSIPADLYEASAIAGAGPLTNFFRITAPLLVRPLMPLLIASFAFNFNNFVLISLLTNGRPDFLDTRVPAGTTDILVSYTYRIAFQDSGQDFGLAAAISTVIFVLIALLSLANLKLARVNPGRR
jgi:maltose/maltodextrin transport system permease protein